MACNLESTSSFYERLVGCYCRGFDGCLIRHWGPRSGLIAHDWDNIRSSHAPDHDEKGNVQRRQVDLRPTDLGMPTQAMLAEVAVYSQRHVLGIVVESGATVFSQPLDDFLIDLALRNIQSNCSSTGFTPNVATDNFAEAIRDLFDTYLRYRGSSDMWLSVGSAYFLDRVKFFTNQSATVQFCLPAFPCKSSNQRKVTGTDPDRCEQIALDNLTRFIVAVESVYPPGAMLWVISDGHVFSDCIGVDDNDVDDYGDKLRDMNIGVAAKYGAQKDRICFRSLIELLRLGDIDTDDQPLATRLRLNPIQHYIDVQRHDSAELCRRTLETGFMPHKGALRARIDAQDMSTLALYRGFSRFMFEDLEQNRYTMNLSKSQRRACSTKIAFEMIQRNQAYTNLVETFFPMHVRLSAHAHDNAGPKFGIRLLGSGVCATNALSVHGEVAVGDDLHIPTPWHGCIVQVEGDAQLYMTKAHVARSALSSGEFSGSWVTSGKEASQPGYFSLRRNVSMRTFQVKSTEI